VTKYNKHNVLITDVQPKNFFFQTTYEKRNNVFIKT